ncbi:hypothetical protein E1B28_000700 [Marasmius oreades]|uniref:C2H2-type domain-containing protein n=1 Tax=Marasmius oreades TaxID=181124 RepID=A0A9P7V206_9AGAR|nr:uncharacterized protein E1B28_000700 [Marasmius oreades]KAG7098795.1 hypothetical protein E1B28_000700 [Marasmius oreades]
MSSSRNGGARPTLPSIRDVFREELRSPPRTRPESPSLTLARLRVDDDVSSIQRGPPNHLGDVRSSYTSTSAVRRPSLPLPPSTPRSVPTYPSQVAYTYPHPSYSGPSPYIHQAQERTPTAGYQMHHPGIPYDSRYPPVHDHRLYARHPDNTPPLGSSYKHHDFQESSSSQTDLHIMDQSLPAGSKYECGYCGKGFNRPSSLKIHLNSHTGEKPFRCPVESCGRSFSVLSNMRRHARVHTQPSKDTSGDEGNDSHTHTRRGASPPKPGNAAPSLWHYRRDSSGSTSSSGSRRSYSVSSDSGDELDVPMPPGKRARASYAK